MRCHGDALCRAARQLQIGPDDLFGMPVQHVKPTSAWFVCSPWTSDAVLKQVWDHHAVPWLDPCLLVHRDRSGRLRQHQLCVPAPCGNTHVATHTHAQQKDMCSYT